MFRKLILTAVVAAGTVAGLTARPATASAQFPGRPHGRDGHDYAVLVRHHGHWDRYRVFDDRDEAERVVWQLEREGQNAHIEVVHRHR